MTGPTPRSVRVGPSPAALRNFRVVTILVVAPTVFLTIATPSWFPLLLAAFVLPTPLYLMRQRASHVTFDAEHVTIRSICRSTQFAASDLSVIMLLPTPGVAFAQTRDGGSAVVGLSGVVFESANERRVRLHDLEMLGRLYAERGIEITGTTGPWTFPVNRSSQSVKWRWIPPSRGELFVIVGAFSFGALCFVI